MKPTFSLRFCLPGLLAIPLVVGPMPGTHAADDDYTWNATGLATPWTTAANWNPNTNYPQAGDNIVGNVASSANTQLTGAGPFGVTNFTATNPWTLTTSGDGTKSLAVSRAVDNSGTTGTLTFQSSTATSLLAVSAGSIVNSGGANLVLGGATANGALASLSTNSLTVNNGIVNINVATDYSLGLVSLTGIPTAGAKTLFLNSPGGSRSATRTVTVTGITGTGTTGSRIRGGGTGTGTVVTTLVIDNAIDYETFAEFSNGVTTGVGTQMSIVKQNNGVQTFSGGNGSTYTGGTTITAGTLLVNNTTGGSGTGTGSVSVTGGIFGGAGIVKPTGTNTVSVSSGAFVAPGSAVNTTGTLVLDGETTTGALLTMSSNARFSFDLGSGSASDKVNFWNYSGAADFVRNGNVIDITLLSGATSGTYNLFNFYSDAGSTLTASGISDGLSVNFLNGGSGTLVYGANSIDLSFTAVPEPGTIVAGLVLLAFVAWRERRRFHSPVFTGRNLAGRH